VPAFRELALKEVAALLHELPEHINTVNLSIYIIGEATMTTFTNLGQIANLNFQGIQVADSINANVGELLKNKETEDIGNAIRELTKAIGDESRLSDSQRKELLEQVELLGSQASMPVEQRKRGLTTTIK